MDEVIPLVVRDEDGNPAWEGVTMAGQVRQVEQRGGDKPDWGSVVAGEPLPQLGEEYPEPDSGNVPLQDGHPLWPADNWGVPDPPGGNDPEAQ